jgi:tRNA dimethylallyltransferase
MAIFLAGATAVGKSEVALRLAERGGGEIISVDSMQVYRGLDVGTAKPSAADRGRVAHHLIDVVEVSEGFDAARFCRLARVAREEIEGRGRVAIFCGGTGFYFNAFLEGIGASPPSSAELRAELEKIPMEILLREIEKRDPVTFGRIDRKNPRRVIRAVEVIRLTGRPFSEQRSAWGAGNAKHFAEIVIGLRRSPEELQERIDRRVEAMFAGGLVEETRAALDKGLAGNPTAMQAIGYRQVTEHLAGARSLEETIALVKTRTRQFARRQMTWFRRQLPVHWVDVGAGEAAESVVEKIQGTSSKLL